MTTIDAAIIGGTGIGERLAELGGRAICVPTPEGPLRGRVVETAGKTLLLIRRHSVGHKTPPHRVNYRAFALGLKRLNVKTCFATAAVGSMRTDWPAGTLAVPTDFVDLTFRQTTMYDRTVVHTDFSKPFPARTHLLSAAQKENIAVADAGIYVCGNGPRYETPYEIDLYGKIGDLVGMTAASEAIVMRESGIDYGCLCVVTNLACGISETPLNHEEVVEEMERKGEIAVKLLLAAVNELK